VNRKTNTGVWRAQVCARAAHFAFWLIIALLASIPFSVCFRHAAQVARRIPARPPVSWPPSSAPPARSVAEDGPPRQEPLRFSVPASKPARTAGSDSLAAAVPTAGLARAPDRSRFVSKLAGLPLVFEANQGQADPRVKFLSHGQGYALFLMQEEAVLSFVEPSSEPTASKSAGHDPAEQPPRLGNSLAVQFSSRGSRAKISGESLLRSQTNYFLGSDRKQWRRGVPNYTAIEYTNVFPGIDAIFHGNRQRLEFDFDVAPGADPSLAELEIVGARKFRVNKLGDIVLIAGKQADVVLGKPFVYQEIAGQRREIAGNFVLRSGNRIGFSVGAYDHSIPLVIDPTFTLAYSTYLGGTLTDRVNGIAVNPSTNATYVVGTTTSTSFPATSPPIPYPQPPDGAYQTTCPACSNGGVAFVAKFDSSQNLVYYTYLGPTNPSNLASDLLGTATGNAIAVDSSGNAYITGQVTSQYFPTVGSPTQTQLQYQSGGQPAYVAELSDVVNGQGQAQPQQLLNSTFLGGNVSDQGNGIALDAQANVYVAGTTESAGLATPGALESAPASGNKSSFVAQVSFPSGVPTLGYYTYLLGSTSDVGAAIVVDPASGNAYVGGTTGDSTPPATAANDGQTSFPYSSKETAGFLAELNSQGTGLLYFSYLGGTDGTTSGTRIDALALDPLKNVYATGTTSEADLPNTTGTVGSASTVCAGAQCPRGFVAEFTPTLSGIAQSVPFVSYFGGTSVSVTSADTTPTTGAAIAVDSIGDIFVTGSVGTTDFPEPGASPSTAANYSPYLGTLPCAANIPQDNECESGFLVEFAPGATSVLYSTYLGGVGTPSALVQDQGTGIALDTGGDIYVVGTTNSGNFPTGGTETPLIATHPGSTSGFVSFFQFPTNEPAIAFSPPIASFGTVPEGETPSITLTVSNISGSQTLTASYTIASTTSPNPFSITPQTCSYSLAQLPPVSSCNFTLSFNPPAPGSYTGTLTFVDNAPQGLPDPATPGDYQQTYFLTAISGPPALTSITAAPVSSTIMAGQTQQFAATGNYSSGPAQNLTNSVTWASSDPTIALITGSGLAYGLGAGGPVTITATSGSVSGTASLTVTAASTTGPIVSDPEAVHVIDQESINGTAVSGLTGLVSDSEAVHVIDQESINGTAVSGLTGLVSDSEAVHVIDQESINGSAIAGLTGLVSDSEAVHVIDQESINGSAIAGLTGLVSDSEAVHVIDQESINGSAVSGLTGLVSDSEAVHVIDQESINGSAIAGLTGLVSDSEAVHVIDQESINGSAIAGLTGLVSDSEAVHVIDQESINGTAISGLTGLVSDSEAVHVIDQESINGSAISGLTGLVSDSEAVHVIDTPTVTATPVITWSTPAPITYGTALSGTQLDATANVAGTFVYSPAAGTVLGAGSQTLSVTFTPSNTTAYSSATATVTLTVRPAPLNAIAGNATRQYGQPNPPFSLTFSGFVNGDTPASLGGTLSCTTTATITSSVGVYPITCSGLVSPNYTITFTPGTLTVTQAVITITANNLSKAFDAPNPTLTWTASGFVNGDTTSVFTVNPVCTTTATTTSPVGIYPITCSGAAAVNYSFVYVAGTLTITCHYVTIGIAPSTVAPGGTITVSATVMSCSNSTQTIVEKFVLSGPLVAATCSISETVMFTTPPFALLPKTDEKVSFPFVIPKSSCPGEFTITSTTFVSGNAVDTTSVSFMVAPP